MTTGTAAPPGGEKPWRREGRGVVFTALVSPRARQDGIQGWHGDALKVRVAAPPAGGQANERLVALLADAFGVAPGAVELVAGAGSRRKRIRVSGPSRFPDCFGNAVAGKRSSN